MKKFLILGLIPLLLMVPGTAFADDFKFTYECVDGTWVGTITSIEGEVLPNTTVRTTEKISATNYEKKFVTDENGVVKIPNADNTGSIWIQKGGFNDLKSAIKICSNTNSNNSDSQIIILTNPNVAYGGEFWNFNDGSGFPVAVIVDGEIENNGVIKLITKSRGGSGSFHYEETYSISPGFPKHLFNLDYPFKFDTVYTLTAINGNLIETVAWTPLPSTPQNNDVSYSDVPSTQTSRIVISGETNPEITKGMISKIPYTVEVKGILEENYKAGGKGGWLEHCYDSSCSSFDKVFMISESNRIYDFEYDFGYYWELDDQFSFSDYDPKPKVVQLVFRFEEDVSRFNIYPNWVTLKDNFKVDPQALSKVSTKSAQVIRYMEAGMDNRWFMIIEVCSGQNDLQKPTIIISSDIESTPFTMNKSINALSCARDEFQVKAINPKSVTVGLERLDLDKNSSELDALKEELAELRKMLEEKEDKPKVPGWVKNNVQWWANGQVDDATFINGIEFMVKEKVINIPDLPPQASETAEQKIPDWIRNNAIWWSEGAISEDDFVNGIEFLVQNGIIQVQ